VSDLDAELRARMEAAKSAPKQESAPEPESTWDDDLIPVVPEPEAREDALTPIIDRVNILEAYRRWCGKSEPDPKGKRESIMVSCPKPDHRDSHPSAWLNLDKGTWFCGTCQEGGDKYDIAAYKFGMPVPGYKEASQFPKLREQMARDLGVVIRTTLGGSKIAVTPDDADPEVEEELDEEPASSPATASKDSDSEPAEEDAVVISGPFGRSMTVAPGYDPMKVSIPWREIVPEGTFLHEWMTLAADSDEPNEYMWWLGMMAVATAAGNNVMLMDSPRVRANLMVCLLGSSGSRKSRAIGRLMSLLESALPYDHDDPDSTGTMLTEIPASGEALIDAFCKPVHDDMSPGVIVGYAGVRGLIKFGEFTDFSVRASRQGNTLKSTIMNMFDSDSTLSLRSRTHGIARADHHFGQVISSTQPKAIRELLTRTDVDSGFVNRWIFAKAIEKPRVVLAKEEPDTTLAAERLSQLRGWCSPRLVKLHDDALDRFTDVVYHDIFPNLDHEDSAVMERLDLLFKKIVLILAINERKQTLVEADLINRAAKLIPYLIHTYQVTDQSIGFGPFEDCCDSIKETIASFKATYGRSPSGSDIRKNLPKRFNAELMMRAMKALIAVGAIEETLDAKKITRYEVA
jgi:hypothetical protein